MPFLPCKKQEGLCSDRFGKSVIVIVCGSPLELHGHCYHIKRRSLTLDSQSCNHVVPQNCLPAPPTSLQLPLPPLTSISCNPVGDTSVDDD